MLDVNNLSELFVILSKEPPGSELQPKGGGGSFPGGISNLTTSLPLESTYNQMDHLHRLHILKLA